MNFSKASASTGRLRPPPLISGRAFSLEESYKAKKANGLLSLKIELGKKCNLRCPYCFSESGKPAEGELSTAEILRVVDEGVALGAKTVTLMGGEPTLHKDFFRIVEHVRGAGVKPVVFTNGTRINKEFARNLFELDATVITKLNSFDAELQRQLAGRSALSEMLSGINCLIETGFSENSRLSIESVVAKQNINDIPGIWRWARQRNIVPFIELLKPHGRGNSFEGIVSREEARDLFNLLLRIDETEYGFTWIPTPPIAGWQCQEHKYSCYVTANGEVQPCSSVAVSAGNVLEKSLTEILKTELFKVVREVKKHLKGACGDCGVCIRCRFKACAHAMEKIISKPGCDNCYGCRGWAYSAKGDFLAADEMCWREVR